jgi:hypothetical protein
MPPAQIALVAWITRRISCGYLKNSQRSGQAEAEETGEEDGGEVPYAALVGGGAAIAVAGGCMLLALRRKKKA